MSLYKIPVNVLFEQESLEEEIVAIPNPKRGLAKKMIAMGNKEESTEDLDEGIGDSIKTGAKAVGGFIKRRDESVRKQMKSPLFKKAMAFGA